MKYRFIPLALAAASMAGAVPMQAQVAIEGDGGTGGTGGATPVLNWNGSLPAGSFGGSGNPTSPVVTSTFGDVTLGLAAQQRYTSPAPTYDGHGTFTALTGESTGAPTPPGNVGFAAWNFDYYVGGAASGSTFKLFVDYDPAMHNMLGDNTTVSLLLGPNGAPYYDSSNLGYANHVVPGSFDPNAAGQYTFWLQQYNANNALVQDVSINVDVVASTTTTPEPSSLALLGTGFVGLVGFVKRRTKRA